MVYCTWIQSAMGTRPHGQVGNGVSLIDMCADGTNSAAVKRLTDDKLLQADVRMMPGYSDDSGTAELRQVILYDKQTNINSVIAERGVTFTADESEL